MNISDIGSVIAISMAIAGSAGTAGKFYLDTQYVGNDTIIDLEIRQLKREVRRLERIPDRDDLEQYYLDDLKNEIEDLEAQKS